MPGGQFKDFLSLIGACIVIIGALMGVVTKYLDRSTAHGIRTYLESDEGKPWMYLYLDKWLERRKKREAEIESSS